MSDATITKSKLFKEDIALATGGTGAVETGTRLTSAGGVVTLTKLDLGHIPYRSFPGTPEDLLDGGQDIDILPHDIDAGGDCNIDGTLTVGGVTTLSNLSAAGYVKNSAAGVLSTGAIAAADLPTAIDAIKIANGSVTNAEFQYISTLSSNVQDQINTIVAGGTTWPATAILQNRQNSGTAGGTATTGVWDASRVIPFNVEYEDASNIVDFSAPPAFTLAAGTYKVDGWFRFAAAVQFASCRLYNVTDVDIQASIGGLDIYSNSNWVACYDPLTLFMSGTFIIAVANQFRVEYQVNVTVAASGLGAATSYGPEVYAQLQIMKLA